MILSRPLLHPQQRFDLEDFNALLAAGRADSLLYTRHFTSSQNYVLQGFAVSGIGLKQATVTMADATLIIPQTTVDFSWFTAATGESPIIIPEGSITPGVRNYVEIQLTTQNNTLLTRAFWDPSANSGAGSEFNQIVNTITDLQVVFNVLVGGFSGSPDSLPLCIMDVDGSNNIKTILDRRNLFYRLALPTNLDNTYAWGTKLEPVYSLNLTAESGTFVAGETITLNTESATVVTGGTTSITFNAPTGINFFPGSTVTGLTSGATGTINTVLESFTGVDKSILNDKQRSDAIMSEIRSIKGTRFWWESGFGSIAGVANFINTIIAPFSSGASISWDGSAVSVTDDSGSPSDADVVAKIRSFGKSSQLNMTRQDGTGGSVTIPLADGQVLFVKLPTSGDRTYDGIGSGDTNYQVANRASFVVNDADFWLAYREGVKIIVRGIGELETGESTEIGEGVSSNLLSYIGVASENISSPTYTSNIRGASGQSLTARLGVVTDAISDEQEDRSAYFHSDSQVTWTGSQLQFPSDIVLDVVNTKSGTLTQHSIALAGSPASLNNGESLWISIVRTSASEVVTLNRSSITPIPAQTQANKDVIILARRVDAGGLAILHLPLHKQTILPSTTFYLGTTPVSTGDLVPTTVYDPLTMSLPVGASATIDGHTMANGDTAVFGNLSVNPNRVYQISGVGTSISWTPLYLFAGSLDPANANSIKVLQGTSYKDQIGIFDGTKFEFKEATRHFEVSSGDYWEESSLKTINLTDGTTAEVFHVTALGSENLVLDFSIVRNGNKDVGQINITTDGITANHAVNSAFLGVTGITFISDVNAGNVRLRYVATATGFDGTMKFSIKRWSDLPGGPGGVPQYTPIQTIPIGYLDSAFAMSDGSGTNINTSAPFVVGGKTRLTLAFSYTVGVDPGTTAGDLEVVADGLVLPRFFAGATLDAYYKEIDPTTIEFYTDLSSPAISLEVRRKQGTIDTSSFNEIRINAIRDAVAGSASDVLTGRATHSSIQAAINDVGAGGKILILPETFVENVSINKKITLIGYGTKSIINGTLTFTSAADGSLLKYLNVTGNITFNASSQNNVMTDCWQTNASSITDSGTNNLYTVLGI